MVFPLCRCLPGVGWESWLAGSPVLGAVALDPGRCASRAGVSAALELLLTIDADEALRGRRRVRAGLHLVAPVGGVVSRAVSLPCRRTVIAPGRDPPRERLLAGQRALAGSGKRIRG